MPADQPEMRATMIRTTCTSFILIAGILLLFLACEPSTPYDTYMNNLVRGKELLKRGEFEEARNCFVRASEAERLPESIVYAAITSYKMNDIKSALYYIGEVDRRNDKGYSELRIDGYKALILLKAGNQSEGLKALEDYAKFYSHLKPLTNIWEVEAMARKQRADIARLEALIDEQITRYEDEIEQFQRSKTGPYDGG